MPLNNDNLKIFKSTAKNRHCITTVPIGIPTMFSKNENNGNFSNNTKIAEYLWFGLSGLKISNLQYFLKLHFLFYPKLFPDKSFLNSGFTKIIATTAA